jgi:hypothetical protein
MLTLVSVLFVGFTIIPTASMGMGVHPQITVSTPQDIWGLLQRYIPFQGLPPWPCLGLDLPHMGL